MSKSASSLGPGFTSGGAHEGPVLPDPEIPFDGESLPSLIARYAGEIGVEQPSLILAPLGMENQSLAGLSSRPQDTGTAEVLRHFLGLDPETFLRLQPWTASISELRVLGHELPVRLVDFSHRRFCPGCLAEAPFHRAAWDMLPLPGCARHRMTLQTVCPACGVIPRWTRSWPHLCSAQGCRAELADPAANADLDEAAAATCGRIEHLLERGVPAGGAPLSPADTLVSAARLGCFALDVPWGELAAHGRLEPSLVARLMASGLAALDAWPDGLHACLNGLRAGRSARKGRRGAQKELGQLVVWIGMIRNTSIGEVLCPAVDAWMAHRQDLSTRVPQVDRIRGAGDTTVLTVNQAARRFGLSARLLRKVAERQGLFTLAPNGSGEGALVDAAATEAALATMMRAIDRQTACALLGVGKLVLVDLIQAGLLRELPERERVLKHMSLDRGELERWMAGLEAAVAVTGSLEGALSLKDLAIGVQGGIVRLLGLVTKGRVRPVGIDAGARGLNRLLFAPSARPPSKRSLPSGYVAQGDLAAILGIDRSSVTEMVAAGLFGTEDKSGRFRLMSLQAVERFREECVLLPEIASAVGLPWQTIARRLRLLGVEPFTGPAVDGRRRSVFRRPEVEAVMEQLAAPPN